MRQTFRRFLIEFGSAIILYALFVVGSVLLLRMGLDAPLRIVAAIVPMVPALGALWAVVRYYRTLDELHQRMQAEAVAFSFITTGLLTFAYSFLENAGLPHARMLFVLPTMIVLWSLGYMMAKRRYE